MAIDRIGLRRTMQLALGCAISAVLLAALSTEEPVLDAQSVEKRIEEIRARPAGPIRPLPEPIRMPHPPARIQRNPFAVATGNTAQAKPAVE